MKKFLSLWVWFFICLIIVVLVVLIGGVVEVCGDLEWLELVLFVIGLLIGKLIFVVLEVFEVLVIELDVDIVLVIEFVVVIVIWFIGIL